MRTVDELTQEELQELKDVLDLDTGYDNTMSEVKNHYRGTHFTEDDFWCNTIDDI